MALKDYLGIQSTSPSAEIIVSTIGSAISISTIGYVSFLFTGFQGALAILPSMGAATILLFVLPHGALSQPWALFAGNFLSAIVGVACAGLIENVFLASGIAVGLAILVMHLCRCMHPPGGATALAAVIGGEGVKQLDYSYVITPTLINCLIIFAVAFFFNNIFAWRRYPLSLMRFQAGIPVQRTHEKNHSIDLTYIRQARESLGTLLDVNDEQIKQIIDRANQLMTTEQTSNFDLELGAFYTNGAAGMQWSVRQVIDEAPHANPHHHIVIYRVVDGYNKHRSDSCTLQEFSVWAKQKMRPANQ